jgi:hypothetical protein
MWRAPSINRLTGAYARNTEISGVEPEQQLLHVKTAIINGQLDRYTGHHSVPADIDA